MPLSLEVELGCLRTGFNRYKDSRAFIKHKWNPESHPLRSAAVRGTLDARVKGKEPRLNTLDERADRLAVLCSALAIADAPHQVGIVFIHAGIYSIFPRVLMPARPRPSVRGAEG